MENPAGAVFIIPGPGDDVSSESFQRVGSAFRRKGVNSEYIEPEWEDELPDTIEAVEEEIEERLEKYGPHDVYLFGNSLGAVIALTASTRFSPRAQLLSSMPPVFSEDLKALPLSYRAFNGLKKLFRNNASGFNYSLQDLKGKDTGYKHLVYNGKEYSGLTGYGKHVSGPRLDALEDSRERVIEEAKRSMNSEKYLSELEEMITGL